MMKAKKKPVETIAAADLEPNLSQSLQLVNVVDPPARTAGVKLASVDELIDVLKNKVKVL